MKFKLLLIALLITSFSFGQSKKEKQEIKNIYWGKNNQRKNVDVPEKWKNESAVILYQENFYDYHKFAKNVRYTSAIRNRVKLLDQAAVKEFSEFSFAKNFKVQRGYWTRKAKRFIGIRIIKPDGKTIEKKVDEETFVSENENYKLAISGLEVGDIIDYYVHTIESFKQKYGYTFRAQTNVLNDEYPIKEFVLKFNTENDFFINFQSYNGAPKLEKIPTDKRNDRRYKFTAKDIEKQYPQTWFYPKLELPYYKFQATFARSGKFEDKIFNFLSDKESEIKTQVTAEEVLELFKDNYGKMKNDLDPLKKYFKDKKSLSKKQLVNQAYDYLRHFYNTQHIQPAVLAKANIISPYAEGVDDKTYYINKSGRFNTRFANFLIRHKIPFDIVVVMPRQNGKIKDLLYTYEIGTLIKVNLDEPIYLTKFSSTSNIGEIPYTYEGADAYALKYSYEEKKLSEVSKIIIPKSNSEKNKSIENTTLSINSDFSEISVNKIATHTGHNKNRIQDEVMFFFDYLDEDYKHFKNPSYIEAIRSKKYKAKVSKEYDALIEKYKTKQKEIFTEYTDDEYNFSVEDVDVKILNTGRYQDNDALVLEQSFNIKDQLIKKAGKNYIFEVGKLIGGQVDITGDERERINDIYMNYPRVFENNITINIPEGYNVVGLDKLQKNITNDIASFKSEAVINGNQLEIKTTKTYKENQFSKVKWKDLMDALDAALKFSHEKILFKQ